MGNLVQTVQRAGDHQQFASDAFDSQIGKTVPLTIEGQRVDSCKVVAAEVAEDGSSVTMILEVPDGLFPAHAVSVSVS